MKRKGFTLIELLVVISIIALLMAILMPVLQKAKGAAKGGMCKSNMHQIGIAADLYARDYESFVPRGENEINAQNPNADQKTWYMLFMPYLSVKPAKLSNGRDDYRSVKIYRCPSYPNKEQTICYVSNGWDPANIGQHDRGFNRIQETTKLMSYVRLGSTIYLADNEDGHWRDIITEERSQGWDLCDIHQVAHLPRATEALHNAEKNQWQLGDGGSIHGPRVARKRHGMGCNCLFADWHVESMTRTELAPKTSLGGGITNKSAIDLWRFKTR